MQADKFIGMITFVKRCDSKESNFFTGGWSKKDALDNKSPSVFALNVFVLGKWGLWTNYLKVLLK
ncbi:hypothetical protein APT62_05430 [Aerococcus urinaeequi]|nr:hypothetical protein APT62_05430 [Aerococcus urinaeequi]